MSNGGYSRNGSGAAGETMKDWGFRMRICVTATMWFDIDRIANGNIVERWDSALQGVAP